MHRFPTVDRFFGSGNAVLVVLGFMSIELIVLILIRKKFPVHIPPLHLIVSVSAGAALLLALREALRQSGWERVAAWLIVALGCHFWDLNLRLATRRTP
jgi:RsiW-degrading membrane proteinase PrsW (M82 family)